MPPPRKLSSRRRAIAAALVAAAAVCSSSPQLAAAASSPAAASTSSPIATATTTATSSAPRPLQLLAPQRHQLDVCSLHYATDAKKALASMELSYRGGKCVVAARTVSGATCDPAAADTAVLLGPFLCEAPVTLGAVSARLAADAARRSATAVGSSTALAGPGLNAWLTVSHEPAAAVNAWLTVSPAPAAAVAAPVATATGSGARNGNATAPANATATPLAASSSSSSSQQQPACMLTLQEPTKLLRAPGGTLGSGGRAPYVRGAYMITGLGCRAGVDPSRASVDAAADALLGGPAEQRRPFTFGLWVAPHAGEGAERSKACRLIVSATAPAAERAKAMARSAVAGDAFLSAEALACDHVEQLPQGGPYAEGCCYAGRR